MGRPRKKAIDLLEESPLESPLEEVEIQEETDLAHFLNEVGPSSSYLDVYRVKTDGTKPRVIRVTWDVIKNDVEGYLEQFGTSRYELVFRDHQNRIRGRKKIDVEAHQHPNGNGITSSLAIQPKDNFERELLLTLVAKQQGPDIGSLLQGLAAMQPKFDMAGMLASLVTAFTAMKSVDQPKDDMLEKLPKVLEIVKAFTPEAKGEENLYTVAKDVGTKLIEAIKPRQPSTEAVQPNETKLLPANPQNETDPETMFQQWLKAQLQFLKSKARASKDPAFFADYILDNDEEPGNNAILTALERGATFENLCQFDNEISIDPILNRWFQQLYENLSTKMSTDSESETSLDTGRADGNKDHPGAHEGTGAAAITESEGDGSNSRKPGKH